MVNHKLTRMREFVIIVLHAIFIFYCRFLHTLFPRSFFHAPFPRRLIFSPRFLFHFPLSLFLAGIRDVCFVIVQVIQCNTVMRREIYCAGALRRIILCITKCQIRGAPSIEAEAVLYSTARQEAETERRRWRFVIQSIIVRACMR